MPNIPGLSEGEKADAAANDRTAALREKSRRVTEYRVLSKEMILWL